MTEKLLTEIVTDEFGKELFRWEYNLSRIFKPGQTRVDNGKIYEVVSSKIDFANGVINTVVKE